MPEFDIARSSLETGNAFAYKEIKSVKDPRLAMSMLVAGQTISVWLMKTFSTVGKRQLREMKIKEAHRAARRNIIKPVQDAVNKAMDKRDKK